MQKNKNYKQVQFVLFILLIANLAVAIFKILIGSFIKSSSMVADGFHSISDGSSNIVGMIGIHFASKPEDDKHPYGHTKIEIITGLIIGLLLISVGVKVVIEAIDKIKNPITPNITISSIIVLIITLCVNIFVTIYEHKKGKQLNSQILISDANHTKSDIFVTIGVLLTLILVKLGLPPILDQIVSFVVAIVIFHTAWEVLSENGNILIDAKIIDEEEIKKIVFEFNQVKSIHKIRSRGTYNNIYIDMHIMVDPDMKVSESHKMSHIIESQIQEKINENAHVLIHIEPYFKENNQID